MASTRAKTKAAVGIIAYIVWFGFVFYDPVENGPDFLKFNIGCVVGVVGLVLRDMPHVQPPPREYRKEPPP